MKHCREIDGLHALVFLPVLFSRIGISLFCNDYIFIDIFFVTSGFLITALIMEGLRRGTFSDASFHECRLRGNFLEKSLKVEQENSATVTP